MIWNVFLDLFRFSCVYCFFLKRWNYIKDFSAWISRTPAEFILSQIDVINVPKNTIDPIVISEHVYMRPEVNWNQFEISLQCKISLRSTWQKWNFKPQWVFHVSSKCPQWNKIVQNHLSCKLVRMCFAAIVQKAINSATSVLHWLNFHKLKYRLHMCNRVLLLFKKLPQWNLHINCHVNGTAFQSGLRFQTGLNARLHETRSELKPV